MQKKNKTTIYFFGGIFGALVGIAAAYLLDKSGEMEGGEDIFTKKNLSKIGLGTISLLYSLIGKGKGKRKRISG